MSNVYVHRLKVFTVFCCECDAEEIVPEISSEYKAWASRLKKPAPDRYFHQKGWRSVSATDNLCPECALKEGLRRG